MTRALLVALLLFPACSDKPTRGPAPTGTQPPAPEAVADAEPRRTEALDALFGSSLTQWVIALNNDGRALSPEIPASLDATVKARFEAALAAAQAANEAVDADLDARADAVHDAVLALNRALIAARLDYALDASVVSGDDTRHVLLFSFTLERHRAYRTGDRVIAVHWGRRLDELAYTYRLLGFAGRERDPLILLPSIERELVRAVLPLVAGGEHAKTGSDTLDAAVHRAAREAAVAIGGRDVSAMAALIARRSRLFDRINARLRSRGAAIPPPTTRVADPSWRRDLVRWLEPDERDALSEIEAALAKPAMATAFAALLRESIVGVEQHEVQHLIDFANEVPALAAEPGLDDEGNAYVTREVSAQLAEMARSPASARLSLARIVGRATSRSATLERIVGRRILALLANASAPLQGEELEVAALAALRAPADKLMANAAAAWRRAFGKPIADASLQDAGVHGAP